MHTSTRGSLLLSTEEWDLQVQRGTALLVQRSGIFRFNEELHFATLHVENI